MSNVLLVSGVWCVCGAEVCCKAVKLFRCQQLLWCGGRRRQRHHNRGSAPSARRCSVLYLVIGGRCILRQTTKINAEAELQICKTTRYVLFPTHPLKKGLDKKINIRLLTPVFIIIYQAEHNLWCPGNVGWENFA